LHYSPGSWLYGSLPGMLLCTPPLHTWLNFFAAEQE
jgi:hypothetical protein